MCAWEKRIATVMATNETTKPNNIYNKRHQQQQNTKKKETNT